VFSPTHCDIYRENRASQRLKWIHNGPRSCRTL